MKLHMGVIFENLSKKFKIHDNLTRIQGTLHENLYTLMITYFRTLLRMRIISDKICTENQNKNFIINNFFTKIVPFMR